MNEIEKLKRLVALNYQAVKILRDEYLSKQKKHLGIIEVIRGRIARLEIQGPTNEIK